RPRPRPRLAGRPGCRRSPMGHGPRYVSRDRYPGSGSCSQRSECSAPSGLLRFGLFSLAPVPLDEPGCRRITELARVRERVHLVVVAAEREVPQLTLERRPPLRVAEMEDLL